MKSRLPLAILAVAAAGLATVAIVARPGRHDARTAPPPAPGPHGRSSVEPPAPPPPTSNATSTIADRILAARDPFALMGVDPATALSADEIARLCELVRSSAPAHRRMIALAFLARQKDPDGRILAAIRDATAAREPEVAHKALDCLGDYAAAHPERSREAHGLLFARALGEGDVETRSAAAGAIRFDRLDAADEAQFARLFSDPSLELRAAAIDVAGAAKERKADAAKLLSAAFRAERTLEVRTAIAESLWHLDGPSLAALKGVAPEMDPIIDKLLASPRD
jgi:hypothetical protein